jgi:glycerophosphoryl diester phosphodiesterase
MSHPFATRNKLVFAHRGGAKLAPENTMPAFERGLALGSDGIECDVHLSRDGVPVVIHDNTLDRTTDAMGPVNARTASELRRLDAGFRFVDLAGEASFRGKGVGVPTLEDVLACCRAVPVIIELKTGEPALARAVTSLVRRLGAVERVCVGSFYRAGLDLIRREAPEIATSASEHEARWTLYRSWCRWPLGLRRRYCAFQVPERAGHLRVVTPAFLEQAHRDGARVDVWVVDDPGDMRRLFAWGVDGVITDRPDIAVPVRNALTMTPVHAATAE